MSGKIKGDISIKSDDINSDNYRDAVVVELRKFCRKNNILASGTKNSLLSNLDKYFSGQDYETNRTKGRPKGAYGKNRNYKEEDKNIITNVILSDNILDEIATISNFETEFVSNILTNIFNN